jgi:toxin ParE1/3/4
VSLAESAVRDLEEVTSWYAALGAAAAGDRLVGEVIDCLDQLAAFPESGRIVPEFAQPWLRELIRPPFRIVYRLDSDRVRVVRVWRSERLLGPTGGE